MDLFFVVLLMCGIAMPVRTTPQKPPSVPETSFVNPPPPPPPAARPPQVPSPPPSPPVFQPGMPPRRGGVPPSTVGYVSNIVQQTQESSPTGDFSYSFVADNGISVEAKGSQKSLGPGEDGQVMDGRYSYPAPDGTPIVVQWFADETGFHVIP